MAGKRGVGILLNKRWSGFVHRWRAISERIGVLELNVASVRISLVVVYMPHCGYSDAEVQAIYDNLSALHAEARRRKRFFIFGGDFNAEVAGSVDESSTGNFANDVGNSRGDFLKRWATAEHLVLLNTIFEHRKMGTTLDSSNTWQGEANRLHWH
jgi:hypothetical protein